MHSIVKELEQSEAQSSIYFEVLSALISTEPKTFKEFPAFPLVPQLK